ncbi:hypothetical protein ACM66B_006804 [Microbotryomycetes sp. NB124-2]
MSSLATKLKAIVSPSGGDMYTKTRRSLVRRAQLVQKLETLLPAVANLLIVIGLAYLVVLPAKPLGRRHYISENALQPAQVNTYWNWADVHVADLFAEDVAGWIDKNLTAQERSRVIAQTFQRLGLPSATQRYSFALGNGQTLSGTNTYAIYQAPKTDGVESLVLCASWLSREVDALGRRRINVRGVATVLAMANYLKKSSYWSKDIVFLLSDGYLDGTQAWLNAFHGYEQSNLAEEPLSLSTGGIWAALNLDYPHHSFSHVGLFYEGTNGHLTNLDFVNSAVSILKHTGVPVVLHSDVSIETGIAATSVLSTLPGPARKMLDNDATRNYICSAQNLARQLAICAIGAPVGPEGLFGRYWIDALTFFGVPADGPHGFHALGRAVESTFRSLNNLLERFHQSFFLYIMTSTETFITVGNYLAAPILVGAGLTLRGLWLWSRAGAKHAKSPISSALAVIFMTHALGSMLFLALTRLDPTTSTLLGAFNMTIMATFGSPFALKPLLTAVVVDPQALSRVLLSFNLLLAGLALSVVATLNFGAAVALSLTVPAPLLITSHLKKSSRVHKLRQALVAASLPAIIKLLQLYVPRSDEHGVDSLLTDWQIAANWSLPLSFVVVVPLCLQAAIAAALL